MGYKAITCPKCGESRLHVEGDLFVCDVCESTFTKEEESSLEEKLEQYRQMNQEIDLGHLRYLIRNELKKNIRDYKLLLSYVLDVLKVLPEDFQALYFKHLCNYKRDPNAYDEFLIENKTIKLSNYEKDFLYPFIIDECQYRSRISVSEFLRAQKDYDSQKGRLENAMKQRELESDLFANYERDVFICHASLDNKKVLPIVKEIEDNGYQCWYGERNLSKDIDTYYPCIEDAIRSCKVFLVFMSTNSIMSKDVQWEINKAKLLNKKRIEYRLEDRNNNPLLKDFFAGIQWVDGAFKDASEELIDRIYRELNKTEVKEHVEIKKKPEVENEENKLLKMLKYTLYLENFEDARSIFNEALQKDFDNPLLYQYGILLETENKKIVTPLALKHYQRLLKLDPENKDKYEKEYSFLFTNDEEVNNVIKDEGIAKNAVDEIKKDKGPFSLDDAIKLFDNEEYEEAMKTFLLFVNKSGGVAEFYIGNCFEDGLCIKKDISKAMEWYGKAVEQGDDDAQLRLGYLYEREKKDFVTAFEWYLKSAKHGNILAQRYLGICYQNGKGVKLNVYKAIEWYRKAAEQGDSFSQCNLGFLYEKEMKDYVSAYKWYLMSAEQGNMYAQNNLGRYYQFGYGVKVDINKAIEWYRRAAEQGYEDAKWRLSTVYK